MPEKPVKVGVVGTGAISAQYLRNARNYPILEVTTLADLDPARARARAEEFDIPRTASVQELLADPDIEIVLNLTVPKAHGEVAIRSLAAGKHTFHEKPFAVIRAEGRAIIAGMRKKGLRVGCAPDTFLGSGFQTARRLLDEGVIGRPVAFTAQMLSPGVETWHPNPPFYYEPGGGPLFDMGPYYLTALLNLLGPVSRAQGFASIAIGERLITSEPLAGTRVRVTTPDHVCALIEFENGATGTLMTSFAVTHGDYDRAHPIVIYGTEGAMRVPDPNHFDGTVELRRKTDAEWVVQPAMFPTGHGRSVGLADMAQAIREGRKHRCSAEQAFLVLEMMHGILLSSDTQEPWRPMVPYERPAPMPKSP